MKKLLVMFSAAIFMATSFSCSSEKSLEHGDSVEISLSSVATGDNSQNSLDWKGVYKGVLPCADCEGIETTINLKSGGTFKRIQTYLGKKDGLFADEGTFQWDEKGSKITLYGKQGESQMYLVGENALFHLDKEGNRISGDLAPNYILPKNPTDPRIVKIKNGLLQNFGAIRFNQKKASKRSSYNLKWKRPLSPAMGPVTTSLALTN